MKIKKQNIILASFLILIGLTIGSIGVSFAWFNFGSQLNVGNLDITFKCDKDLKVSLTQDNFKEELSFEDMSGDEKFLPVSSMFSKKWLDAKATKPLLKTGYNRGVIENPATFRETQNATSGFFQKEIYLQSGYDIGCTIDSNQDMLLPNEKANDALADQIIKDNGGGDKKEIINSLNKVSKAMRISILDPDTESYSYTIIDPYKDGETLLCGRLALNHGPYYDYYTDASTGEKKEFLYGEFSDDKNIVHKDALDSDSKLEKENQAPTVFNAKTKKDVKACDVQASLTKDKTGAIENSMTPQEASDSILIKLKENTPKKIVVTMYLEGWDLDNTNDSILGSFLANIKFKLVEGKV